MERPPNEAFTHIAMSGEQIRGPGIVLIDVQTSSATFVLMDDLNPPQFKSKIEEFMHNDGDIYFYMVQKDGLNLHVFKTQREAAKQQLLLTNKALN